MTLEPGDGRDAAEKFNNYVDLLIVDYQINIQEKFVFSYCIKLQ